MTLAYDELCRRTRERDRSLREKVTSLEEAAAIVPDGASVGDYCGRLSPRRRFGRHWRQHIVPDADGDDLGLDSSRP